MYSGVVTSDIRWRKAEFLRPTFTRTATPLNTSLRRCCLRSRRSSPGIIIIIIIFRRISRPAVVTASRRRRHPPPPFRHTSTTPPYTVITTPTRSRASTTAAEWAGPRPGRRQVRAAPAGCVTSRPCPRRRLRPLPVTARSSWTRFNWWHLTGLCDSTPVVFFVYFALVIGRTVIHDLSVLVIRRTMQINNRPTEIIIYFWKQEWRIAWVSSLNSTNTYTRVTFKVRGLRLGLGLGLGFVR